MKRKSNYISDIRKKLHITQKELANRSGLSLGTIQKCELNPNSVNKLRLINAIKLAEALGISITDLEINASDSDLKVNECVLGNDDINNTINKIKNRVRICKECKYMNVCEDYKRLKYNIGDLNDYIG